MFSTILTKPVSYWLHIIVLYIKANIHVVSTILPDAKHSHYARHIKFWKIAKAFNEANFNDALAELASVDEETAIAFKSYNPKCNIPNSNMILLATNYVY